MKGLKHTIEHYKKLGLGSEKIMNESIALMDEKIFMPMMELHPEKAWSFMREWHTIFMGEHFDEKFAKWEVDNMHHKGADGIEYKGEHWNMAQTNAVYAKIKSQLTKPYNEYDWYVTLNMIFSDHCNLMKKWFPTDTEEQLTEKYIQLAVNWLNDEDYKGIKVWKYFEELHEID